jgi:RNA polymerase sigma factor (sigma-70 family)
MPQTPLHAFLVSLRRAGDSAGAGLTDAELLQRFVTTRDEAAFEALAWRHATMVWGICRRVARREQDAEDAFQATFLTLAQRAASIHNGESLGSWLFKVSYRIALAARRQAVRRAASESGLPGCPPAQPSESAEGPELRSLIDEEVHRLPEKYRAAVVLCYFQGRTNEAAAQELGCPKGTVVSRLARARQRLRRRLEMRGVEAPSLLLPAAAVPRALFTQTCNAVLAKSCSNSAAGAVSARVITLVQGAVRTMFWTKMRLAMFWVGIAVLGVGGTGLVARTVYGLGGIDGTETGLTVAAEGGQALSRGAESSVEGQPGKASADDPKARAASMNNLKQILLAMHNYHDVNGHFPAPATTSGDGKALLSWRVALLPYLDQNNLFKQFRVNEPWDSEHNRELLDKMPSVFAIPGTNADAGSTYYQVFVGPGAAFEKRKRLRVNDFTDGTSNTVMVIEAGSAVPWTKPEDLVYDPDQPLPELGGAFKEALHCALADGSAHTLRRDFDRNLFRAAITRNGGEVIADLPHLFSEDPRRLQAERLKKEQAGLVHAFQGLRDEVLLLRAEVNRLKERVEKLEGRK